MGARPDPMVAPLAREDLRSMSRLARRLVSIGIARLAAGQIDASEVRRLIGSDDWRWIEFAGWAVVFRMLSDIEIVEKGLAQDTLVIQRIVSTDAVTRKGAAVLADIDD